MIINGKQRNFNQISIDEHKRKTKDFKRNICTKHDVHLYNRVQSVIWQYKRTALKAQQERHCP